jgi:hypothetical protein
MAFLITPNGGQPQRRLDNPRWPGSSLGGIEWGRTSILVPIGGGAYLQRPHAATSVAKSGSAARRPSIGNDAWLLRRTSRLGWPGPPCSGFLRVAMLALSFLLVASAEEGRAEVAVTRDHDEIRVSVENDTVGNVLQALAQNGDFHYRAKGSLDKVIGGNFSGSWGQVLSGILVGFDFAVVYRPESVEIVVFGESGAQAGAPAPTEASPQPQTAPPAAKRVEPRASLAPRHLVPRAPSESDMATSNLAPH